MRASFATSFNADLLDENYSRWKEDPASVDSTWSAFFEGFEFGSANFSKSVGKNGTAAAGDVAKGDQPLQTRVDGLVYAYRTLGHTIASLDPLTDERPEQPLLSLQEFGFIEKDLDLVVASKFYLGGRRMKLREMIASLEKTYAGTVGHEFMHIQNTRVRNWIRERVEAGQQPLTPEVQRRMLRHLMEVESFEHFLHTKYVGQKRFSLEGGESLIVILNAILEGCPKHGVQEIVMGMAHRGRLSVISQFLNKSLTEMFAQFSENYVPNLVGGDGDVKYHLGYQTVRMTEAGHKVEIRLSPNPSHLEAVDPVVEGMARARQRIRQDTADRKSVLPLLMHGDAAFAGQGIVAEVLNMSQLPGYKTGGTIHVIVNNQIGFTTLPADARSSIYATDVAKMIEAPIFHVNGDDPAAVAWVTELALEFRQQFRRDVVIDMYCYRRHGHNEGDEPIFTQPDLYAEIDEHPSVANIFKGKLIASNVLSTEEAEKLEDDFEAQLQAALDEVKRAEQESGDEAKDKFSASNAVFQPPYSHAPVETAITRECMDSIVRAITKVPDNFNVLAKVKRMVLDRRATAHKNGGPYDWAFGEALAFASLLLEGTPVRLSGQDSRRGTFSQRHSVLYDQKTRERYIPLLNLSEDQARFCVYNSLLSEAGVLGFDYGYSLDFPSMLCIWEAQFGDFSNGAQVIIDQFIVSAESKWQRPSGIVMLLPHGYEGQGPEHSSARLERYLQLCAEENIQVCNLTTPAQYFHVLRRQMRRGFRKPLVIMTPKSLLRSERAVSTFTDFTESRFREILPETLLKDSEKVDRAIFCSGKVYYDLLAYREEHNLENAAIIRVEQLYPLDLEQLKAAAAPFTNVKRFVWCQEESQNMGAWNFIGWMLRQTFKGSILYAGRAASASTAVGALAVHRMEQKLIIEDAFNI